MARALDLDVSRARLRAGDLRAPFHGVRSPHPPPVTLVDHARELGPALRGEFAFSHLTAARLFGLPTPAPWRREEPLDVMRPSRTPLITRRGVRSHRGLERRQVVTAHELATTDPVDTWVDLANELALDDLVAIGDSLRNEPFLAQTKELRRAADDSSGRRVRRLRQAAGLVRAGAASAWESKARVAFSSWGLPEPQLNVDVHDVHGRWLARPDFV